MPSRPDRRTADGRFADAQARRAEPAAARGEVHSDSHRARRAAGEDPRQPTWPERIQRDARRDDYTGDR
jgi:hypothetical protein